MNEVELQDSAFAFAQMVEAERRGLLENIARALAHEDDDTYEVLDAQLDELLDTKQLLLRFVAEENQKLKSRGSPIPKQLIVNEFGRLVSSGFFAADESVFEVEFEGATTPGMAAYQYVAFGDYQNAQGPIHVDAYQKAYEWHWEPPHLPELVGEPINKESWTVPLREKETSRGDDLFAILLNPKTRQLIAVEADYDEDAVSLYWGEREVGSGYLDSTTYILDREREQECPRTHTPEGTPMRGQGYGLLTYCALALLAATVRNSACVGSAGRRSESANRWWERAVERGLALEVSGQADVLPVANVLELGLVVYWGEPLEDFVEQYEDRRSEMVSAYLTAKTAGAVMENRLQAICSKLGVSETEWKEMRVRRLVANGRTQVRIEAEADQLLEWALEFA